MKLSPRFLGIIISIEIVASVFFAARHMAQPPDLQPPEADWKLLDSTTAEELRAARSACHTAEDWRKLGEWYMASGCFLESEQCHRGACERDPHNAVFIRQWAFALERVARLDEANEQYRRAMQLAPRDADKYRYFIARNLLRADKPAEARILFDEGKELAANRYELARLQRRAGELDQAQASLKELLRSEPTALQVHVLGYRLALEEENLSGARFHADRARYAPKKLLNPFDEEAERIVSTTQRLGANRREQEVRERISAGQLRDAEMLLRAAERTTAVTELLAEIAVRQNRFGETLTLLNEIQTANGSSARLLVKIGDVEQAMSQPANARASWLRAAQLEAGVDLKATHHKLADSFAGAGAKKQADWHRARGHYYVGRDLLQFGYADKAIAYFEAAARHDPQFTQAWFYLGEVQRLTNQKVAAENAYRTCLQLNPEHGRSLASLAGLEGDNK